MIVSSQYYDSLVSLILAIQFMGPLAALYLLIEKCKIAT